MNFEKELDGIPRSELEVELVRLRRQVRMIETTLTICQERGTELLLENRRLSALVKEFILPGWICALCRAFNGEAKETLTACRCCGAEKAT